MIETTIRAAYATGAIPAFLLRRLRHLGFGLCLLAAALTAGIVCSAVSIGTGADPKDAWFGVGLFLAAGFGAIAGAIGAGAAMWFE